MRPPPFRRAAVLQERLMTTARSPMTTAQVKAY